MITRPKLALLGSIGIAFGIIYYVHSSQNADRKRMKLGVQRDIERQLKKEENRRKLEEQKVLEETLKTRDKEATRIQ